MVVGCWRLGTRRHAGQAGCYAALSGHGHGREGVCAQCEFDWREVLGQAGVGSHAVQAHADCACTACTARSLNMMDEPYLIEMVKDKLSFVSQVRHVPEETVGCLLRCCAPTCCVCGHLQSPCSPAVCPAPPPWTLPSTALPTQNALAGLASPLIPLIILLILLTLLTPEHPVGPAARGPELPLAPPQGVCTARRRVQLPGLRAGGLYRMYQPAVVRLANALIATPRPRPWITDIDINRLHTANALPAGGRGGAGRGGARAGAGSGRGARGRTWARA